LSTQKTEFCRCGCPPPGAHHRIPRHPLREQAWQHSAPPSETSGSAKFALDRWKFISSHHHRARCVCSGRRHARQATPCRQDDYTTRPMTRPSAIRCRVLDYPCEAVTDALLTPFHGKLSRPVQCQVALTMTRSQLTSHPVAPECHPRVCSDLQAIIDPTRDTPHH